MIHTKRVYVRVRPSTDVHGRRRAYADIEHMLDATHATLCVTLETAH